MRPRTSGPVWWRALPLVVALCICTPVTTSAQEPAVPEPGTSSDEPTAHHAIYVEVNSALITASLGLTYEYRFSRVFSLSGGLGASASIAGLGGLSTQALAHWLMGGPSSHSFEAALGASATAIGRDWMVLPATFLGYRYHPLADGGIFRVGLGWSYGFGIGVSLTGGWVF